MPGFRNRRFSIYDAMESRGIFDENPANQSARDPMSGESLYKGPVEYPKLFYHPDGAERITVPGEYVETKLGIKLLSQQKEIITAVAHNVEEEEQLRVDGWHDHPAKAMKAAGKDAPAMTASDKISQLEAELARLRAQASANTSAPLPRVEAPSSLEV